MATNYRSPALENFTWQPSVADRITQATLEAFATWAKGVRYLLTDGVNANKIVYCNNDGSGSYTPTDWSYNSPMEGMIFWVDDEDKYYHYNGSTWIDTAANWNTAYGWGNHASAGYLTSVVADAPLSGAGTPASHLTVDLSSTQPASAGLSSLAMIAYFYTVPGLIKLVGQDSFSLDTSTYLTVETDPLSLHLTGGTLTGAVLINCNSLTAFKVEQTGVKNNVLVIDTTNGRVGINTAPSIGLHLVGEALIAPLAPVSSYGYTEIRMPAVVGGEQPVDEVGLMVQGGSVSSSSSRRGIFVNLHHAHTTEANDTVGIGIHSTEEGTTVAGATSLLCQTVKQGTYVGTQPLRDIFGVYTDTFNTPNYTNNNVLANTMNQYGDRTYSYFYGYLYNTGGGSITLNNFGVYGSAFSNPIVVSGTVTIKTYGGYFLASGNALGNSLTVGVYVRAVGADTNYDIVLDGAGNIMTDLSTGKLTIGGINNTNNENLVFDFETTANTVIISSTTGVTALQLTTTLKLQFRDTGLYIYSSVDGQLDIVADTLLQLGAAGNLELNDAVNIVLGTTNGTRFGTGTTQKIGFYNVLPIVQPSAYTQTYSAASKIHTQTTMTNPATYATGAYGYSTEAQASAIHAEVIALRANMIVVQSVLNQVIDDLQALGLVA